MGSGIDIFAESRERDDLGHQNKQGQSQQKKTRPGISRYLGDLIEHTDVQKSENARHSQKPQAECNGRSQPQQDNQQDDQDE